MLPALERRRQLAAAATLEVAKFMRDHDVHFDGAGEEGLLEVSQAWSIDHTDSITSTSNWDAIEGIAAILKRYRSIRCRVHGETGAAKSAPLPLARYLGLDAVDDVRLCMDTLARARAQACVDALVAAGVPADQLYHTYQGMGGEIRVEFAPDASLPPGGDAAPSCDNLAVPHEPRLHREYRRTTIMQFGPRHLPPRQSTTLRNRRVPWASRDLRIALRKFPRVRRDRGSIPPLPDRGTLLPNPHTARNQATSASHAPSLRAIKPHRHSLTSPAHYASGCV